jgi:hypothetical protein
VRLSRRAFGLAGFAALAAGGPALAAPPAAFAAALRTARSGRFRFIDTTLQAADGRTVAVRLARPARARRAMGFIAFSHGANSAGTLYDAMIGPIAAAGYLVAAPTHVDWEGNPGRARFDAAAVQATRLADMALVFDGLVPLAAAAGLAPGAVDPARMVAAGHSYGALVAQQLGGAEVRRPGAEPLRPRDPRARAILAVSPPGPVPGFLDPAIWDGLDAPMLVTTGTQDTLPNFRADWRQVLASFERGRPGQTFAAIAPGVDHYFGGAIGRLTLPGPKQSAQLDATNAAAILFLDAFVKGDASARRALTSFGSQPLAGLQEPFEIRTR